MGVELVVGEGEELVVLAYACGVFQVRVVVVVAEVAREWRLGTAGSDVGSGAFPVMTFCG